MVVYAMQILINENNLIISYATVGGFDEGIEIDDSIIPQDFIVYFKPKRYLYNKGAIEVNNDYEEENEMNLPIIPPTTAVTGTDKELRHMFSSMQVQIVQGNRMVTQLTQQNANLSQQIVQLSQEVENLKGGYSDETTIS